jgi:flagellar hook-length control protein FliK
MNPAPAPLTLAQPLQLSGSAALAATMRNSAAELFETFMQEVGPAIGGAKPSASSPASLRIAPSSQPERAAAAAPSSSAAKPAAPAQPHPALRDAAGTDASSLQSGFAPGAAFTSQNGPAAATLAPTTKPVEPAVALAPSGGRQEINGGPNRAGNAGQPLDTTLAAELDTDTESLPPAVQAVIRAVRFLNESGEAGVYLQLEPAHLGPMRVRLTRAAQGGMEIKLNAGQLQTARLVRANLPALAKALEAAGVPVSQLLVSVGSEDSPPAPDAPTAATLADPALRTVYA